MKVTTRFHYLLILAFVLSIAATSAIAQGQRVTLPTAVTAKRNPVLAKHNVTPQSALNVYDHGDPTAEEQYELELINRARANPPAEGNLLFSTTNPWVVNQYTQWGTPTRSQVKSDFAGYAAQMPLAFNKDLIAAARRHSQDMLDHNYQAHDSPTDGSSPFTRMQQAGYVGYDFAGENIFAYGNDLDEINQEFEIDFGNPGLGHRENLINFGTYVYTEIGIGILHGGSGSPNVGPIITTEDFGHKPSTTFITGVVYGDDNHNNFYDVGEGLAGATITVSGSSGSAVSSGSGGYAIPITDQGTVTVTASGGLLTSPISHQVTLSDVNVKVDFIQGATGFPAQAEAVFPISDTVVNSDTVIFRWNAVAGATKYRFQLATDPAMKKLISNDSLLTTASKKFGTLKDVTTYYWRVQAKNTIGWGQSSPVVSFSVALPLGAVVLLGPANGSNTGLNDIMLNWRNTNPGANDFWIEISPFKTMANPIKSDTLTDTTVTYAAVDFEPGTTYYWRARGENEIGLGKPSAIWSFITGGTSSVATTQGGLLHSIVSPNPSTGETHIKFSVSKSAEVSLKVFGVTGVQESMSTLGQLSPNDYDIVWNGKGKAPGVYIYELSIGEKRETGRIVVIK